MNELDQIDGLDANAAALERTLGDTAGMAAAFDATLRDMQVSLGETTRDLGNLERGFAGGLRRAFDGLIFDGKSLSDTLSGVAKSMIDTAYAAAINPVMKQAGSLLSDGINAAVSGVMSFAQGAPFA
ncbi:MAG: phage tail tape measure protein, partial [Alphaproteobacteria bacterium]|nr:phage tail tape measure protein [Alphaproteobacteria bacterium]